VRRLVGSEMCIRDSPKAFAMFSTAMLLFDI
jgi:hypothetical protein